MNLKLNRESSRATIDIIRKLICFLKEVPMKNLSSWWFWLAIPVLGGCCTGTGKVEAPKNEDENNIQLVEYIEESTVALVENMDGEKQAYCTGVWVSEHRILTANHCVETIGRIKALVPDEQNYDATGDIIHFINHEEAVGRDSIPAKSPSWVGIVEATDNVHDLAVLYVEEHTSHHSIAHIANENVKDGELLHIMGHTVGMMWSYSRGYVSSTRVMEGPSAGDHDISAKVLQVSSPAWMGNSGGGAFDAEGHLVGICSWITRQAPNVGFFIHHDELIKFLNKIAK